MNAQFEPMLTCDLCEGTGWIEVRPNLSKSCKCRYTVGEAS